MSVRVGAWLFTLGPVFALACQPQPQPLPPVTVQPTAAETSITFAAPAGPNPARLVAGYDRLLAGGVLEWAHSTDGANWVRCNQNGGNCSDGTAVVLGTPSVPSGFTFGGYQGDPTLVAGPPGSGLVMMVNVAQVDGYLTYFPNSVAVLVSVDNGRTFPQATIVNVVDGKLEGLNADQPHGDIDDAGNFCITWRHRWDHAEQYHPVVRCGRFANAGAITWLTGIMNVPSGQLSAQGVGGMNLRMRRIGTSGNPPHAIVVDSTPILGDPGNLTDCQGNTRYAGIHFFSTEADIVGTPLWSAANEITFDDHFDYCPLQAIATYDRQFSFAIDPVSGLQLFAFPVNQRPGVVQPSAIQVWSRTAGASTWGLQASVTNPNALGASLFYPNLAADGAGRFGLSFYSGDAATNSLATRMFSFSNVVGTWTAPIPLAGPGQVRNGFQCDRLLLDYQDLTVIPSSFLTSFGQGRFFDCWSDTSTSFPYPTVTVAGVQTP